MSTPDANVENTFFTPRNNKIIALVAVVAVIVGIIGWWAFGYLNSTKVRATFSSAVGLYEGSNVRVLGVDVGKITKVTPQGETVLVEMDVRHGVTLPADVQAVQVIPSLVADRYVQLLPAYSGGAAAGNNVNIPMDRTAVPVEIDGIYANLQKLSKSLGPGDDEVNQKGALSEFVSAGATALEGNGEKLGSAIENLSKAASRLSNSRGDLFSTVKDLDVFVGALKESDSQVRLFNSQMAQFNSFLAGERNQLGKALNTLSYALGDVAGFLADNEAKLGKAIRDLQPTAQALYDNREDLLEIFTVLPTTISNLINAYDAESGTVAMRVNILDLQDPIGAQCRLLDLGKLMPGNPLAMEFSRKMKPLVSHCEEIGEQIQDDVLEPILPILPFGIMSNYKLQRIQPPGSRPGNPDPKLPGGN
ncbi:mammalian cell entry protein [Gordonia iterans]|uniref:Mammalian cell entry protein n=1 Tax=Gordonia iterans TaxID=1004901 RepID=A0A2S0KIY0_9ACTN|nr:MCE family protein [Gordonia iterans]AVM01637.1 mammalian cell entry protein [Gordonia iterans]